MNKNYERFLMENAYVKNDYRIYIMSLRHDICLAATSEGTYIMANIQVLIDDVTNGLCRVTNPERLEKWDWDRAGFNAEAHAEDEYLDVTAHVRPGVNSLAYSYAVSCGWMDNHAKYNKEDLRAENYKAFYAENGRFHEDAQELRIMHRFGNYCIVHTPACRYLFCSVQTLIGGVLQGMCRISNPSKLKSWEWENADFNELVPVGSDFHDITVHYISGKAREAFAYAKRSGWM